VPALQTVPFKKKKRKKERERNERKEKRKERRGKEKRRKERKGKEEKKKEKAEGGKDLETLPSNPLMLESTRSGTELKSRSELKSIMVVFC
jgi:hypothetical protein